MRLRRLGAIATLIVLVPLVLPPIGGQIVTPPPPLPYLVATHTDSSPPPFPGSYYAAKFVTTTTTSTESNITMRTCEWPLHDGFTWFLYRGSQLIVSVGAALIEAEVLLYVDESITLVGYHNQFQTDEQNGCVEVNWRIRFSGMPAGTWTLLATAASPNRIHRIFYDVLSSSAATTLSSFTTAKTGFFHLDRDFQGDLHVHEAVRAPRGSTPGLAGTRGEVALNVEKTVSATNRMFAFYIANGQLIDAEVEEAGGATQTGQACYRVADGAPGAYTFRANHFVGVTPVFGFGAVVFLDCTFTFGAGPLTLYGTAYTATVAPEGLFVMGADAVLPP